MGEEAGKMDGSIADGALEEAAAVPADSGAAPHASPSVESQRILH